MRLLPDGERGCAETRQPLSNSQGKKSAKAFLGFLYENGYGAPQAYVAASDLYMQAAVSGNPFGQCMLGLMYDKGHGVPQDYVLAYKWLNIATARATPREREYWVRIRDAVSNKLTLVQRTAGQDLASDWFYVRRPPEIH